MNPYENLSNAIIEQAVKDYRDDLLFLKTYISEDNYKYRKHLSSKVELEKFFHSGLFSTLTNLDGDYLMKRVQKLMNWGIVQ